jgi:hypothetical protein
MSNLKTASQREGICRSDVVTKNLRRRVTARASLAARMPAGAFRSRVGVVRVLAVVAAKPSLTSDHAGAFLVGALLLVGLDRVSHLNCSFNGLFTVAVER